LPVIDAFESARSSLALDQPSQVLSLVQSPVGQEILGSVLTNPISGSVTGNDIAQLLNTGQQIGIYHQAILGGSAREAAESALPAGIQQFMAMRTQAAAPTLDGGAISNAFAQNRALGLSRTNAQSAALAQHGVALFQGDGAGIFNKVPSSGESER
jgi:hypothetical protein